MAKTIEHGGRICMLLLNLLLVTDGLPSARQATSPNIKMRVEHKRSSLDSLPVTVSLQPMIHSLAEPVPLLLFQVKVSLTKIVLDQAHQRERGASRNLIELALLFLHLCDTRWCTTVWLVVRATNAALSRESDRRDNEKAPPLLLLPFAI